jgi:VIT1/CCC1 family predicted Fe2+/Mn2+ transporter
VAGFAFNPPIAPLRFARMAHRVAHIDTAQTDGMMRTTADSSHGSEPEPRHEPRTPVLDPVDRVSEIVFGVLMAMSFTGTLSVATAGAQQVHTMMATALGCNLAWGLTDAVMYLVRTATGRHRQIGLLKRLQAARDAQAAQRLIAGELPALFADHIQPATLAALHQKLLLLPVPPARLGTRDYLAAFGVFLLVVLATFPVVVPFVFLHTPAAALRVSNLLAVGTLFVCGCALGHYTGERAWVYGVTMMTLGIALTTIIVALGG